MHATFGDNNSLHNCCGVQEIGDFELSRSNNWDYDKISCLDPSESGTGLFISTFINNKTQKAAYEAMCQRLTLIYQSPVKINTNSGRGVFLCVFCDPKRVNEE